MRKLFLLGVVFVLGVLGFVDGAEGGFFVSENGGIEEIGKANTPYVILPGGTLEVGDSEKIISSFSGFENGNLEMEEDGSAKTFKGTVGKFGSSPMINTISYNLPPEVGFEYKLGTTSIDLGENGGEFLYDEGGTTSRISGEGKINVKDGVISSGKSFEVSGVNGDMRVDPIGNGNAKIGIDGNGKISSIENAKVGFADNGIDVSSAGKTNVYHDGACGREYNYLCMDGRIGKEKLITGGVDPPVIEMKGPNRYFEGVDGDYVKISGASSSGGAFGGSRVNELVIEKDRITAGDGGIWEIENGRSKLATYPDGNIYSSRIIDSKNGAMPMKVYTSQDGELGKYYIKADNNGIISTRPAEVGLVERGKYLVHRGGFYEMAEVGGFEEVISGEAVEYASSNVFSYYGGEFPEGVKVDGFTLYTEEGDVIESIGRPSLFGTMGATKTHTELEGAGIKWLPGENEAAVREIYEKSKEKRLFAKFTTSDGRTGSFGDPSLVN